jgi:hypothetical protein
MVLQWGQTSLVLSFMGSFFRLVIIPRYKGVTGGFQEAGGFIMSPHFSLLIPVD